MAVREIAKELYQVGQKIENLKRQMTQATEAERLNLKRELEDLEAQKATLQRKLNELKGQPPRI